MQAVMNESRKVHLISLGCARNRVDSEVMLGHLFGKGWQHAQDPSDAEAIIVNTCGFIDSAKEESIDTILDASEYKKSKPDLKIVVTGCLTQRYKKQLAKGLPEVDFFVGTDEFSKIAELLDNPPEKGSVLAKRTHYLYSDQLPRVNTLSRHSAFVKVAEGCQHQCAFCIIPAIRGRLRSRPIDSIVKEVKDLVAEGVIEVNLIAQDLAAFGRDRNQDQLVPLLKELVKIEKLQWIRPLYIYPENINDEFLELLKNEPKIVKYLDIPVQHASDKILKLMKRDIDSQGLRNIFARLRNEIPGIAIRTSVMVGFPHETEEDFDMLLELIKEVQFDHLGCFSYSQEEGTVAARMDNQIDDQTKKRRLDQVMSLQKQISHENLNHFVGQIVPVLVSGVSQESEHLWQGRMASQAPEIDGVVLINDGKPVQGKIQFVKITEAHDYDLVGEIVDSQESGFHQ